MLSHETSSRYPHQTEAVEAVLASLKNHDRAHLVMACGTGKTRVALWVAEALNPKRVVVFVPSLALISQFIKEWRSVTLWQDSAYLAICSDETVRHAMDDQLVLDPTACDFPVTTDPAIVRQFLEQPSTGVQLVFCTYHSSGMLAEGMQGTEPFDVGVFDEAHKTVGNQTFGLALVDAEVPIKKRCLMTATPKHYDVQDKNTTGEARLVYSMDNDAVYGPRAYTLSFRKAIDLGLISDYKIIISVVHAKPTVAEANPLEAMVVALKKAIAKAPTVSKIISFHRTIKEAENLHQYIEMHQNLNDFKPLHVNGFLKSTLRKKIMETFRAHPKTLITNARCLTEGIDVPAVDMVAFLNKKRSKIDIIQAIGRSLRKVPGKVYGHVFLPLFVADNKGETLEEAVERADYREIWEVIQALSEQDEALEATMQQLKCHKAKTGTLETGLEKYMDITSQGIDEALHKRLQKIISVKVVDRIGSSWDAMYSQLAAFKEQQGHCRVLRSRSSMLSCWVENQRTACKRSKLKSWQLEKLNALGFDWDVSLNQWQENFHKLRDYKEEQGHCNVPRKFPTLSNWITSQRMIYKRKKLEPWKVEYLNALGFDWDAYVDQWQRNFKKLLIYKEKHGHCKVFRNRPMHHWLTEQRKFYKKGKLDAWKIEKLNSLGIDWDPIGEKWQQNFEKLQAHREQYGHCNVSASVSSTLHAWVFTQRMFHKKGKLESWKLEKLNDLGFDWDPLVNKWQQNFEKLQRHKEKHGRCEGFSKGVLSSWVVFQRMLYKNGKLDAWKIERLTALGIDWDFHENQWKMRFEVLQDYREKHGNCDVPYHNEIFSWVKLQRVAYKQGKLDAGKTEKLNALGFNWDPFFNQWQKTFEKLQDYKKKHGHCKISHGTDISLYGWILAQRLAYKKSKLDTWKTEKLNSLGLDWDVSNRLKN